MIFQDQLRRQALTSWLLAEDGARAKSLALVRNALRCHELRRRKMTVNADMRVGALTEYLHDVMTDVSKSQARAIARVIRTGVERNWNDRTVAKALMEFARLEPDRAQVVARTEMARARTDRMLTGMEDGAKVRFTLGDSPCPVCQRLEGKIYTVRRARGVIPIHPSCDCSWSPVGPVSNAILTFARLDSLEEGR